MRWFQISEVLILNDKKININDNFLEALNIALDDVKYSQMDLVMVIDGHEGIGKSFLARGLASYCACYLGSQFTPNDIYFDIDTYIDNSMKHGQPSNNNFKINLLDEGRNVVNKRRTLSKSNVRFTNYMSECRAMRQIHIICIPAFHDLDSYIVLWRMAFLVHLNKKYVDSKKRRSGFELKKGDYTVYIDRNTLNASYENKYIYPKKFSCRSQWPNVEAFSDSEVKKYDELKYAATVRKYGTEKGIEATDLANEEGVYVQRWKKIIASVIVNGQELGIKQADLALLIGISPRRLRDYRDSMNLPKIYNKTGIYANKDSVIQINKK